MEKFIGFMEKNGSKKLVRDLKRMFWVALSGLTGYLMFYMIGYWIDSVAITAMQYLCYTLSALTAIAFYGTMIVWYMDRYSAYRKDRR